MAAIRSYAEINEKISKGQAVVVTAEEIIDLVDEHGPEEAAKRVDVVTTGTFGPMCSSGAFFNLGHSKPRIRMTKVQLNGVNAYAGIAAVDIFIGATEIPDTDPANQSFPGAFNYGGAHVIEDLVAGKEVRVDAISYGTDCYPRQKLETTIRLDDIKEASCSTRVTATKTTMWQSIFPTEHSTLIWVYLSLIWAMPTIAAPANSHH
jgi:L-aspartate semialdehyde sulfurtransferase